MRSRPQPCQSHGRQDKIDQLSVLSLQQSSNRADERLFRASPCQAVAQGYFALLLYLHYSKPLAFCQEHSSRTATSRGQYRQKSAHSQPRAPHGQPQYKSVQESQLRYLQVRRLEYWLRALSARYDTGIHHQLSRHTSRLACVSTLESPFCYPRQKDAPRPD